ncbi:MAG TPA: diaminopimelate epimerase, partial [Myxococcota bacterium]|nr:diaminopimelate epimerase [Myxococcota bacterium]
MPTALPAEAPSVELIRYHGLGNDYLVLARGPAVDAALVRAICDRHTGVGSDGLLVPAPAGACDHGVRIWNPDGSIAEKSGNALRIYARWLSAERGAGRTFSVWTGTDRVTCEVDGDDVAVEMAQRARVRAAGF